MRANFRLLLPLLVLTSSCESGVSFQSSKKIQSAGVQRVANPNSVERNQFTRHRLVQHCQTLLPAELRLQYIDQSQGYNESELGAVLIENHHKVIGQDVWVYNRYSDYTSDAGVKTTYKLYRRTFDSIPRIYTYDLWYDYELGPNRGCTHIQANHPSTEPFDHSLNYDHFLFNGTLSSAGGSWTLYGEDQIAGERCLKARSEIKSDNETTLVELCFSPKYCRVLDYKQSTGDKIKRLTVIDIEEQADARLLIPPRNCQTLSN